MNDLYKTYICKGCARTTILLVDEANKTIGSGKYISCSHCGCRKFTKENTTNDLRDIMKARKYKRNSNGAIIETG